MRIDGGDHEFLIEPLYAITATVYLSQSATWNGYLMVRWLTFSLLVLCWWPLGGHRLFDSFVAYVIY